MNKKKRKNTFSPGKNHQKGFKESPRISIGWNKNIALRSIRLCIGSLFALTWKKKIAEKIRGKKKKSETEEKVHYLKWFSGFGALHRLRIFVKALSHGVSASAQHQSQ